MSNIPANLKTPGAYFDVNTNTQRTGLPANTHKVLFLSTDKPTEPLLVPIDVYDQSTADKKFSTDSIMGRMIAAAVKTNRVVDVQGWVLDGIDQAGRGLSTETSEPISTETTQQVLKP